MVRDALVVAGIAVLVVQVLRQWCGDRYLVPSDSMQPLLHGDEREGDIVFVDKLARAAARRRHDLVVVQHPEKPGGQLVKRIAARGDDADACCVDFLGGDLWLGPDKQRLVRETKDPIDARRLQVPWAVVPGPSASSGSIDLGSATANDGAWSLPAIVGTAVDAQVLFRGDARRQRRHAGRAVPSGGIGTTRPVDAGYVEVTGARGVSGQDVGVRDCGMRLAFEAPCELLCTIDAAGVAVTFHVQPATGAVAVWRDDAVVTTTTFDWRPQGPHEVEFGWLDDRAYVLVDGRRDALFVVPRGAGWPVDEVVRTWPYVCVVGKEPARFRRVEVFRDVCAFRESIAGLRGDPGGWPRFVPPGSWFLVGDNPFDSRDSRHFGAVPAATFLGRPRCVLGPWPRSRWLDS